MTEKGGPRYQEIYGVRARWFISEVAGKDISRNGIVFRTEATEFPYFPVRFEHFSVDPPFAQGRCALLAEGDQKTAFADQNGMSDYVIKRYNLNIYKGENAQELAQKAAEKITNIHKVLEEICGNYYLPFQMKVAPFSDRNPNVWAVYEIQQRGIFVSPWLALNPEDAAKAIEEGKRVHEVFIDEALPELKKRGLMTPYQNSDPNRDINTLPYIDALDFCPDTWDLVTNRLVAVDVIDIAFVGRNFTLYNSPMVYAPRW